MDYDNIKLTKEEGIATIRLNRPDAMNALGRELCDESVGGPDRRR